MIEDLDGAGGPSHAAVIRVVSVMLILAALVGWAVLQSPALRGPYATADPRAGVGLKVRFTPAPFVSAEPAAALAPGGVGCVVPGSVSTSYVFVGGQLVTVTKPSATSNTPTCAALYLVWQQSLVSLERFAR